MPYILPLIFKTDQFTIIILEFIELLLYVCKTETTQYKGLASF